jgi:hypothetical protein
MSIDWRKATLEAILADGTVDDTEVKILGKALKGSEGKIDEEGLGFLIELRNAYTRKAKAKNEKLSDTFEKFFFKSVQDHVLKEGKINRHGAGYLRDTLFAGGKIDDAGYDFLGSLNKKAKNRAAEFEAFYQDVEKKRGKAKK